MRLFYWYSPLDIDTVYSFLNILIKFIVRHWACHDVFVSINNMSNCKTWRHHKVAGKQGLLYYSSWVWRKLAYVMQYVYWSIESDNHKVDTHVIISSWLRSLQCEGWNHIEKNCIQFSESHMWANYHYQNFLLYRQIWFSVLGHGVHILNIQMPWRTWIIRIQLCKFEVAIWTYVTHLWIFPHNYLSYSVLIIQYGLSNVTLWWQRVHRRVQFAWSWYMRSSNRKLCTNTSPLQSRSCVSCPDMTQSNPSRLDTTRSDIILYVKAKPEHDPTKPDTWWSGHWKALQLLKSKSW